MTKALGVGMTLTMAALALAVQPGTWTHNSEGDFSAGKLDKIAVNSLGEVSLGRAVQTLAEPAEQAGMISAMAMDPAGKLYVATSPGAKVYRVEGGSPGKLVQVAELPGVLVRSLVADRGKLLAGVSGKAAGIYRIESDGKTAAVWTDPKVTFVWAIVPGPKGGWYAATGPEGKVYQVSAEGKAEVVYDCEEKNIMSLIAAADGKLIAGTGENGLVLELEPARKSGRILYDAPEREVSSLLLDAEGVLYVGTSDAGKAGDAPAPAAEDRGKPETGPESRPARPAAPGPRDATATSPATAPAKAGPAADAATGPARTPSASKPATAPARPAVPTVPAGESKDAGAAEHPASPAAGAAQPSAPLAPVGVPLQVVRTVRPSGPSAGGPPSGPAAGPSPEAGAGGNAVYRIDKDGFVRPIFRRNVSIMAMAMHEGLLMLGTGHAGQLFAIDAKEDRLSILATVDPKDITALLADAKGRLIIGTANQGGVYSLAGRFAERGLLTSKPLDAGQIARWGALCVNANLPAGCTATIATRSGNVAEPADNTWSSWSAETPAAAGWNAIGSPAGRFLQYRLSLCSKGEGTPLVEQVQLSYQVANLPPVISSLQVAPAGKPQPGGPAGPGGPGGKKVEPEPLRYRLLQAKAGDANNDELEYAVFFRRGGDKLWIKLAEKLSDAAYAWDTLGVRDGGYELKLEANDGRSNPPETALSCSRVSRAVMVDNTPAQFTELAAKPAGKGIVSVSGTVSDATSRVSTLAYAIDSNDQWIVILPADGIADSGKEGFAFKVEKLSAGTHRVAVRATDEFNNAGYSSLEVTLGE